MAQSTDIPDVGKVELSWVANASIAPAINSASSIPQSTMNGGEAVSSAAGTPAPVTESSKQNADGDFDVADDEDRWMANS